MPATVFLDIDGVLSDSALIEADYDKVIGEVVAPVLGGSSVEWGRANRATFEAIFEHYRDGHHARDPIERFDEECRMSIDAMCRLARSVPASRNLQIVDRRSGGASTSKSGDRARRPTRCRWPRSLTSPSVHHVRSTSRPETCLERGDRVPRADRHESSAVGNSVRRRPRRGREGVADCSTSGLFAARRRCRPRRCDCGGRLYRLSFVHAAGLGAHTILVAAEPRGGLGRVAGGGDRRRGCIVEVPGADRLDRGEDARLLMVGPRGGDGRWRVLDGRATGSSMTSCSGWLSGRSTSGGVPRDGERGRR